MLGVLVGLNSTTSYDRNPNELVPLKIDPFTGANAVPKVPLVSISATLFAGTLDTLLVSDPAPTSVTVLLVGLASEEVALLVPTTPVRLTVNVLFPAKPTFRVGILISAVVWPAAKLMVPPCVPL